jgi:putative oxidoreductase
MRMEHDAGPMPYRPMAATSLQERLGPPLHALLRIGAALLFMEHGFQKLFGWLGGVDGNGAAVPLMSLFGLAGVLELVGGALLLVGLLTRPVAFLLAGQMVVAYAMAHLPKGGLPVQNQGELALLYALVFGYLLGNGAGPLSLDHWLALRRPDRMPEAPPTVTTREVPRRRDTAA